MSVSLRLSRGGSKKRPFYRIVAADKKESKRWKIHRKIRHI